MTNKYILDATGNPQLTENFFQWAMWFESANQTVAYDELPGKVQVSTVFLGIDHGSSEGPPLLFETMIFGGCHDEEQWRWSTRAEALAGHAAVVAIAKVEGT